MKTSWVITREDYENYKASRWDRPSAEKIRLYYGGFNKGKTMFDDEMKDLAMVYKSAIVDIHKKLDSSLPSLLHYMKEFVELHEQKEDVEERLENLMAKLNPNEEEEDE